MEDHIRSRIAAVMCRVLDVEITALDHPVRDQIQQWDSIKHLELILNLEEEFETRFTLEQAATMNDMDSIVSILDVNR